MMINRATGEVDFRDGLHIVPHCRVQTLIADAKVPPKIRTQKLSLPGWKRHIFGFHISEHGTFEVEALSSDEDRIQVVLLAHQHPFYESRTPEDAERRAFHEGVVSSDLAGQREFSWGEVLCRLESAANKDWLVIAYSREAKVPLGIKEVIRRLCAQDKAPQEDG
ncbi:MAG: hypothetical protein U1F83_12695 [Verrucomicrobiota bacterium]